MKLNFALIALSGTLLSTNALANLVTITWADNHSPSGGEFVLTPDTGAPFNSFCLERNEFISLGGTYSYTVNNSAVAGGLAGGSPDPISIGTAYLYSQFRAGTLTGYSSASSANQTALQEAFWWLEDEIPTGDYPFDPTLNPYLTFANDALAGDLDALKADANGAYAVVVWNLYDDAGNHQDMLSVPDGGTTIVLLGMGFAFFGLISHRSRKQSI
jgi:hypothetical protein